MADTILGYRVQAIARCPDRVEHQAFFYLRDHADAKERATRHAGRIRPTFPDCEVVVLPLEDETPGWG